MEVSDSLQALPFELNPDQYSALVEEFHNCTADFLKDLPYAKVTATEEEILRFRISEAGLGALRKGTLSSPIYGRAHPVEFQPTRLVFSPSQEWLLVCVRQRVCIGETSFTYGRHRFVSFLSMEFVRLCGGGSDYAGKVILGPDAMQRLRQPISAVRTS